MGIGEELAGADGRAACDLDRRGGAALTGELIDTEVRSMETTYLSLAGGNREAGDRRSHLEDDGAGAKQWRGFGSSPAVAPHHKPDP